MLSIFSIFLLFSRRVAVDVVFVSYVLSVFSRAFPWIVQCIQCCLRILSVNYSIMHLCVLIFNSFCHLFVSYLLFVASPLCLSFTVLCVLSPLCLIFIMYSIPSPLCLIFIMHSIPSPLCLLFVTYSITCLLFSIDSVTPVYFFFFLVHYYTVFCIFCSIPLPLVLNIFCSIL